MNDIIVTDEASVPAVPDHDALMLKIIEGGNVDALEKFIALREREDARQAKLEFERHFSEMQREFNVVYRDKQAFDYDNKLMYTYATIEALQKEYGPIIANHGFSYTWNEINIEGGKRCMMTISGYGHSRVNSFDAPMLPGNKRINSVQIAGAMSTYGRRYTFISGFGVIIADEDSDGIAENTGAEQAENVAALNACASITELNASWRRIYPEIKNDQSALRYLSSVKDELKRTLK